MTLFFSFYHCEERSDEAIPFVMARFKDCHALAFGSGLQGKFFPKDGIAKFVSHQRTPIKVCSSEKLKKIYKKLNYY